jgi:hypothetical protein
MRVLQPGYTVKAFDPRTLGVVNTGRLLKIGNVWLTIDFGLTGTTRISRRDVVEIVETRSDARV